MKKFFTLIIVIITLISCQKKSGKELKTASGFKYILYTESKGQKVQVGDYVTIEMVYKNDEFKIMYDSRKADLPLRFQLDRIPFKGSFEDGLTNLSVNDSATFYVPADSMYNYLYKGKDVRSIVPQEKTDFHKGTFMFFEIKVLNIQSPQAAEVEILVKQSEEEKQEAKEINKYIFDHAIKVSPDTSGYYLIMKEKGNGPAVDSGKIVTVEYEGRFLNGKVYDGTKKVGRDYRFVSGAHHVIKGWELAMKNLRMGDRFTLIVPSKLAYSVNGIRNRNDATFIVPPNTPLVFDIYIKSVEEVPAVSGR